MLTGNKYNLHILIIIEYVFVTEFFSILFLTIVHIKLHYIISMTYVIDIVIKKNILQVTRASKINFRS